MMDSTTPTHAAEPWRRTLSDRDVRVGCVSLGLTVLVVLALVAPAWRWPGVNSLLAILLQLGLGLAAAVLLDRFLDGYALIAGVVTSALVLAGVYLKPPDGPLVGD